MPGHRPIFVTLVSDLITFTRDTLFKVLLEPPSHEERKAKEEKEKKKK